MTNDIFVQPRKNKQQRDKLVKEERDRQVQRIKIDQHLEQNLDKISKEIKDKTGIEIEITKKRIDENGLDRILEEAQREVMELVKDNTIGNALTGISAGMLATIKFSQDANIPLDIGPIIGMIASILCKLEKENIIKINRNRN